MFPQILSRLPRLPPQLWTVCVSAGAQHDVWLWPGEKEEKVSASEERINQEINLGDRLKTVFHVGHDPHSQEDREEKEEVLPQKWPDSPEQDRCALPCHLPSQDQDHGHLQGQLSNELSTADGNIILRENRNEDS